MSRREFSRNQKEQIVERARTASGNVACERCGLVLKKGAWEIDHVIPEALRPEADKQRKITIAEGQLLGFCCHRGKDGKTNDDVKKIAKAKRVYNAAHGLKAATQKPIRSAGFPQSPKAAKRLPKPALPPRAMFKPVDESR
ncbi:5-methylcytosine-specific restriction endonuclease McrA [Rhizobium sp. BK316]|uniref:HNH endonuclease n=1 Tax=Rhizobium sp. BK316 TaxID=2587053 RepID=UPI00161695BE|nr:HNH endonuclease [Rhizobium sp. BK316]MBB3411282.1 5-methylcytosine-specific restriction endonuclease McrA [Rhizobium sp. BK316]